MLGPPWTPWRAATKHRPGNRPPTRSESPRAKGSASPPHPAGRAEQITPLSSSSRPAANPAYRVSPAAGHARSRPGRGSADRAPAVELTSHLQQPVSSSGPSQASGSGPAGRGDVCVRACAYLRGFGTMGFGLHFAPHRPRAEYLRYPGSGGLRGAKRPAPQHPPKARPSTGRRLRARRSTRLRWQGPGGPTRAWERQEHACAVRAARGPGSEGCGASRRAGAARAGAARPDASLLIR